MKSNYTPRQKQKHLQAWQSSGLSQAEYCKIHKLKYATFNHWCRNQQKTKSAIEELEEPNFIPVQVVEQNFDCRQTVKVNLPEGLSVTCELAQLPHVITLLKSC